MGSLLGSEWRGRRHPLSMENLPMVLLACTMMYCHVMDGCEAHVSDGGICRIREGLRSKIRSNLQDP